MLKKGRPGRKQSQFLFKDTNIRIPGGNMFLVGQNTIGVKALQYVQALGKGVALAKWGSMGKSEHQKMTLTN